MPVGIPTGIFEGILGGFALGFIEIQVNSAASRRRCFPKSGFGEPNCRKKVLEKSWERLGKGLERKRSHGLPPLKRRSRGSVPKISLFSENLQGVKNGADRQHPYTLRKRCFSLFYISFGQKDGGKAQACRFLDPLFHKGNRTKLPGQPQFPEGNQLFIQRPVFQAGNQGMA